MRSKTVTVDRKPKAKARPRHTKSGKVFTPKSTTDEEKAIGWLWIQGGGKPFDCPVEVYLVYTPTQTIIHVVESPHNATTLRGDLDNYVKLTLDALNGVAWDDDGQVVRITAVKVDEIDNS